MIATPLACSRRMFLNSCSDSLDESAAVRFVEDQALAVVSERPCDLTDLSLAHS